MPTDVIQDAGSIILSQGVIGALFIVVAMGMAIVIKTMNQNAVKQNEDHQSRMKEERDEHVVQMNAILERADRIQEQVRLDSRMREEAMMKELSELSCSFSGLSNGFSVFSGILERNTTDIKEAKQEISSLKDVMLMIQK